MNMSQGLPTWFLKNRVQIIDELISSNTKLVLTENGEATGSAESLHSAPDIAEYEVASVLYESMRDLTDVLDSTDTNSDTGQGRMSTKFVYDVVHLMLPPRFPAGGGNDFFATVVHHFARNAGADLVTLDRDDLEDLDEHFRRAKLPRDTGSNSASAQLLPLHYQPHIAPGGPGGSGGTAQVVRYQSEPYFD